MGAAAAIVMAAALAGLRPATPANNPGDWVGQSDYPVAALKVQKEGITVFLLQIDAEGRVADCKISQSSGSAELDAATCELIIARAKFLPATDAAGEPISGTYASRIRWSIPKTGKVRTYRPREIVHSYVVQPDGTITDCRLEKITPEAPDMLTKPGPWPCALQSSAKRFRDSSGRPVAKRVWLKRKGSSQTEEVTDP